MLPARAEVAKNLKTVATGSTETRKKVAFSVYFNNSYLSLINNCIFLVNYSFLLYLCITFIFFGM